MKEEKLIREELIFHLTMGHAHMTFEEAIADFPLDKINTMFINGTYTFWHLLEHIRRTQNDILDFSIHPTYKDKSWPKDYWPGEKETATKKEWDKTIKSFLKEREQLKKLIENQATNLSKKIPHGTGQTIMREIMVVADHNAYHLGEFAIMRQVADAWGKKKRD